MGPLVDILDRIHTNADGRVEYHYVLIDYLCSVVGGHLRPASDASDARWVLPSELLGYAVSSVTIAVIEKALRLASANPSNPS